VTDFFITLAASTMLGDAFFHILPRVLGLHDHAPNDNHDTHTDDNGHDEFMNAIGKIAVVISVMYGFWVFETLVCLLGKANHAHSHEMPGDRMTEESSDDEKHHENDQDAF